MSVAISNLNELCRLCLEQSEMLYKLDSDFCILVMESGASITISEAMKYLDMDVRVAPEPEEEEHPHDDIDEPKPDCEDDPNLPKSLCQDCLEKLQSAYEFKFRCEENRNFLRNYLKECADGKLAEERAIKEAALAALDLDLDNLDSLPDKLVLKDLKKEKKPRKPRDPNRPMVVRRRRIPEKNVIIDEHSQTDSAAYVRKIITTPEQSPEQRGNKRKSKHVIIEDILVNDKRNKKSETKVGKEKFSGSIDLSIISEPESLLMKPDVKPKKFIPDDDEPMFEDDENFEAEPKRSKRLKK